MKKYLFDSFYKDVPSGQHKQLEAFRATHPAKMLPVQGVEWPYLDCGNGKKTLLFLAGAFLRADMWFYSIGVLERYFHILAPDSNILSGLSARQALDALPHLLDSAGVEKVSLIGLSAGGGLAQLFLQEHPNRVEDVVLSHTGVIESQPGAERQIRRLVRWVKILPIGASRYLLSRRTSGTMPASSPWRAFHDAYFRESSTVISKALLILFLENAMQLRREAHEKSNAISSWRGRVLILGSEDDSVTIGSLEKLRRRYSDAPVSLFEKGGHHTFMLFPEQYTSALMNFLRKP